MTTINARQLVAAHGYILGCQDNSCIYGRPGGMATNGGCRCIPRTLGALDTKSAWELRRQVKTLAEVLHRIAVSQNRGAESQGPDPMIEEVIERVRLIRLAMHAEDDENATRQIDEFAHLLGIR